MNRRTSQEECDLFVRTLLEEWPDANPKPLVMDGVPELCFAFACVQARWEGWCLAREHTLDG